MIIDDLSRISAYEALLPGLKEGLAAIEKNGTEAPVGRYEFKGGWYLIQEGDTRPYLEGTYEAHRERIDVQILLAGSEELFWSALEPLQVVSPYDPGTDKERLNGPKEHGIEISAGMFYAAFPWDGHQAVSHTGHQHHYRKIVMKLPASRAEEEK